MDTSSSFFKDYDDDTSAVSDNGERFQPTSASCISPQSPTTPYDEEELSRQLSAMFAREISRDLCPVDYLSYPSKIQNRIIDISCRTKMIRWMYDVVDYCGFERECACVAASYLDRFLSTAGTSPAHDIVATRALRQRRMFQLAAITCLYIAVKTVESRTVLSPAVVSDICEGEYSEADIICMEGDILSALKWRVHSPTVGDFVRHLLALFRPGYVLDGRLMRLTRYQIELATLDYKIFLLRPSIVAISALANALECDASQREAHSFISSMTPLVDHATYPDLVDSVRKRFARILRKALEDPLYASTVMVSIDPKKERIERRVESKKRVDREFSPVCISSCPSEWQRTRIVSPCKGFI